MSGVIFLAILSGEIPTPEFQGGPDPELTRKELETVTGVCKGLNNKQIGAEMAVGEATVKYHMTHVLRKLAASNRNHVVTRLFEVGILRPITPPPVYKDLDLIIEE